jgi:uncharacterized protein (DUF697 family)
MTRKALPRAITLAATDRRDEVTQGPFVGGQSREARSGQGPSELARDKNPAAEGAALQDTMGADLTPKAASPPARGPLVPVPVHRNAQGARRRAVAAKVVDRYKLYAAFGGLSPIPVLNVAGVAAVLVRMVKTLSDLYERPFDHHRTRSVVMGLVGAAAPTGLGLATASTLALAVSGAGFIGVGVSALSAAALTGRIGLLFIDQFESGETLSATAKSDR